MVHTVVFVSLNALNSLFSLVLYTTNIKKKRIMWFKSKNFVLPTVNT